jgi:hypothetical protein
MTRTREMRIGKAGLRIFEIHTIALVTGGWRDSAAGDRAWHPNSRETRSAGRRGGWNRRRFKELIGQLVDELFIRQSREIGIETETGVIRHRKLFAHEHHLYS